MGKVSSILLLAAASLSPCQAEGTRGLDISLISDSSSIAPGSTFAVGLHIQHHSGFHTYWKNPGIVGMATAIEWQLPPGFEVGDMQWPYPELTTMAGHPCHGYERDVTLFVKITAPKSIPTKTVTLTAKTRWMCCARDCFPGFKDFSITLPAGKEITPNKKTAQLFQRSLRELPLLTVPWQASLITGTDQDIVKLRLAPQKAVTAAPDYLFSEDGQISSDQKQNFVKQTDGSYLLTITRSEFSPKGKNKLPAVLKVGKNHYFISPSYPKATKQKP